jgi:regulatory protein
VADDPYVAGLKMLARRELSESQLRSRLIRQRFTPDEIDRAVARLRREQSLDDHRTARACARDEIRLKRHGRTRVLRQLQALGIAADVARDAVREAFAEVDEDALLHQAFERRLGAGTMLDSAGMRRVHRYLIGQGFDPGRVTTLIREYARRDR